VPFIAKRNGRFEARGLAAKQFPCCESGGAVVTIYMGRPSIDGHLSVAGAIDDIINQIKGGKFTLKATEVSEYPGCCSCYHGNCNCFHMSICPSTDLVRGHLKAICVSVASFQKARPQSPSMSLPSFYFLICGVG
jgi:hypothetical protein